MEYKINDFKKGKPRWCPGCGDHFFLASMHKAMVELGIPPHETAVISGIGCSGRLSYYVNTYAMQTIHGRAAAIATGVKVANPQLTVWQISGDGDGLAIGGNHFIHALRRNIDINIVLLNNRIYGFFARTVANDGTHTVEMLKATQRHKGASVCEVLQNCMIFNNGAYAPIYTREGRSEHAIYLEHGKPMRFGKDKELGLMQEGFGLKVVKIGENGVKEEDILIHDAHCEDNTLQLKLAMMDNEHGFPVALGVIRDVEAPTYESCIYSQIDEVKGRKKYHNFTELLETNDTWTIE